MSGEERDYNRAVAEIDQTREIVRKILADMPGEELGMLYTDCVRADFDNMDRRTIVLVGTLASLMIYDLRQPRDE